MIVLLFFFFGGKMQEQLLNMNVYFLEHLVNFLIKIPNFKTIYYELVYYR